jgi:alcohol dehydrogenase
VREIDLLGSDGWRGSDLEALVALVSSGELVPVVDSVVPLAQANHAVALLEDRRCFGKVVVAVPELP